MTLKEEYQYLKGQLKVIEALKSERFRPCRQSNQLKHYLSSQYVSLTMDMEAIEKRLEEN